MIVTGSVTFLKAWEGICACLGATGGHRLVLAVLLYCTLIFEAGSRVAQLDRELYSWGGLYEHAPIAFIAVEDCVSMPP